VVPPVRSTNQRDEVTTVAEIALQLRAPAEAAEAVALIEAHLDSIGLRLERQHADTSDPALARWYSLFVPGDVDVEAVAGMLRTRTEVEAAYVKPAGDTP
jgi:hypothetical protein